jgi:hypothetical protein
MVCRSPLHVQAMNYLSTGIIPHDGKNITFPELNHAIRTTYNFAPTFCFFVPNFVAGYLNKNYSKDTLSLHEIDKHNAIEHDGSLTRTFAPLWHPFSQPEGVLNRQAMMSITSRISRRSQWRSSKACSVRRQAKMQKANHSSYQKISRLTLASVAQTRELRIQSTQPALSTGCLAAPSTSIIFSLHSLNALFIYNFPVSHYAAPAPC